MNWNQTLLLFHTRNIHDVQPGVTVTLARKVKFTQKLHSDTSSPCVVVVAVLGVEDASVGAPLHARSRLLCCLASCSMVSSRWVRCSLSYCSARCHLLLWVSARSKKSRQAWRQGTEKGGEKLISTSLRHTTQVHRCLSHSNQGQFSTINMER